MALEAEVNVKLDGGAGGTPLLRLTVKEKSFYIRCQNAFMNDVQLSVIYSWIQMAFGIVNNPVAVETVPF